MLSPGDTFDRYRVEAVIGRGGSGEVYRAYDERLRRAVALKIMTAGLTPDSQARLVREARIAASLTHPNIVAVYDIGEYKGAPFMAMELVEGPTLRTLMTGDAKLNERVRWLGGVARGLDAAHKAGLTHRDVKPANVMVASSGTKICDFGIAKEIDPSSRRHTAPMPAMQTAPGFSVGTPRYMAPEQINGERVDGRADQFAWGLLAHEVLLGKHARGMTWDPSAPWTPPAMSELPKPLADVIRRTLLAERDERYPSMAEVVTAIEAFETPSSERSMPRSRVAPPADDTAKQGSANQPKKPEPDEPTSKIAREPAASLLRPIVAAAMAEVARALPTGSRRAVVLVNVDTSSGKGRLSTQIVASDEEGELHVLDGTDDLVIACALMVAKEHADGNNAWRRLVLKVTKAGREASVDVEVR